MNIDPSTTKYLIKARLNADGIVEKPDVVGAIFGQTEGLLGDDLDLRDLQKSGRIGRIEVDVHSKQGKSDGEILIPSSLDQVETVILASALETIDRVGPCKAKIAVESIEDVRVTKRAKIVDRAKELLTELIKQSKTSGVDLTESVRQSVQVEEIIYYGKDHLPAGPNVQDSDAIIVVEGRSDVLNLLKSGIKNAIAVEGTNIPKTIGELSKERVVTAFVDGDRGGELILRELFQVAEVDFVARAPRAHEVEELTQKQIMKCLRNKIPGEQFVEMFGLELDAGGPNSKDGKVDKAERLERFERQEKAERAAEKPDEDRPEPPARQERSERQEREPRQERRERPEREERRERQEREPRQERQEKPAEEPRPERLEQRGERRERPEREERRERQEREPRQERQEREPRERPEKPQPEAAPEPVVERRPTKKLSENQEKYRSVILELSATSKAKIMSASGNVKDVPVKELVNTLKAETEPVSAVVFDGIITQRILDIAAEKEIGVIVGTKMGNITKQPSGVEVWTKDDLN
ncbi:MAG: DNA primase DnaG [Methanomassiliicoccales archaeon PtaU1.Bin124]|nr:MAG: DNA primase DnaG [Methanomassiliicoccales archaeon PtaU1.Bin124]